MTADRWRRIEDLCHAALALPPADRARYLENACAGDDALKQEVESLIAHESQAAGFMSTPAAILHTRLLDEETTALPGRRLGSYDVRSLLGVGGMGEVYRAFDPTLGREVAIKVLPPAFASDAQRRARFEREARMLATLNHPNIAAIYGVQDADGVLALILELVEGQTLAERIASKGGAGLRLAEVLDIARQIAEALDAAHDKGIVHRDLKPANIKITPDGVVKVLDFGLAKEPSPDAARTDVGISREGVILGTAAYMSPEQTRGQAVDRRGDIWAFGCVVYEMLTGRHAFPGETISDTIAQILGAEPDWSALPADTPPAVRRLLRRCLTKHPKQRLRDIGDVSLELDALAEDATAPAAAPAVAPRTWIGRSWLPWIAVAALAAALVVVWTVPRSAVMADPLANAEFRRFTDWDGNEESAEISPDGKFVAFLSDRLGQFDVWLSQIGSRHFTNLTREVPALAPAGAIVRKLGFSADGAEVWFNPGDGKALQIMPMTLGPAQPFLRVGANTPAWSPDGTRIAYVYKPDRDDPMYVTDRSGADPQQILPPGTNKRNNPVWSPDNQWIYFVSGPEPQDEIDMDVMRVRASGGTPERLTNHAAVMFLTVLDARTILYIARADDWSGPWLWALDVETKATRRVASGVDQYTSVAASRDGSRVVATVANPTATLWKVPILNRPAQEGEAEPYSLPTPMGRTLAPRLHENTLFFLSAGSTGEGLWKIESGVASEIWKNVDGALSEPPAISPDGQRVAVVVRHDGKRHLSVMSADGTNRQTLAPAIEVEGVAGQGAADWSPDGTQIVVGGHDSRGPALFLVPLDGRAYTRLVEGKWVNPVWSPKGNLIVYAGRSLVGQVRVQAVRPADGQSVELPELWVRPGGYRFLPDESGLVYLPRIQGSDFWLFDLATKASRPLTQFHTQAGLRTFDVTPDGRFLVFDRSRQNSDVVLIDVKK